MSWRSLLTVVLKVTRDQGSQLSTSTMIPLNDCGSEPDMWCGNMPHPHPPRRKPVLLHMCTRVNQHKAQEETWPVSGLKDQRYPSVTKYETRG